MIYNSYEVERALEKLEHDGRLTVRERWSLCDLIWGGSEHWKIDEEINQEARRMAALDQALSGSVETALQITVDVFDESIQIDILWNNCQGAYAEISAPEETGPVFKRAAINEHASGPTLAASLIAALVKARLKIWQAEKAERDARDRGDPVTDSTQPQSPSNVVLLKSDEVLA